MSCIDTVLVEWKKKIYKPIYWIEGEESYFIDELLLQADNNILSEDEKVFNLFILYGKDTTTKQLIDILSVYPMVGEKQLVLLKEAQHITDIELLHTYISNPAPHSILVVGYKEKKLDGRSKLMKCIKEKGVYIQSKKLYEDQLPAWVEQEMKKKEKQISPSALLLLCENIGNQLSLLSKEIDKICMACAEKKEIQEQDIKTLIGNYKEYNIFDLQKALSHKNWGKVIQIVQYFILYYKENPIQVILASLFTYFTKVYQLFAFSNTSNTTEIAKQIGVHPYFLHDYLHTAKTFNINTIEKILLSIHQYNLKSIGIHSTGAQKNNELLKEMLCSWIYIIEVIA